MKPDTCFLDAQSVNPMLKTLTVPWVEVRIRWGVRSQNRKITRIDEDEKLAELISVAARKDWEALEVVDFLARAWGAYSVFILRMLVLLISY